MTRYVFDEARHERLRPLVARLDKVHDGGGLGYLEDLQVEAATLGITARDYFDWYYDEHLKPTRGEKVANAVLWGEPRRAS